MGLEPSSWPALKYRDQLPPAARQEFESLVAQIITFLSRQHAEDGSHVDVTGATLTLTGAGAIGTRARLITPGSSTIPTTTNVLRDGAADGPKYTVYRLAPTANATVQTIYAQDSDALAGQLLVLINTSAFTVTLKHRFSGGIGDITAPGSADYVINANASVVLWFDRTTRTFWVIATVSGTASPDVVTGPASSVDNEIALYSGVTGKIIKRATGTGLVHATSGVYSVGTAAYSDIQNISATARALGRKTAGAGVIEELSLSDVLDLLGSAAQGDLLVRGAASWAYLGPGAVGTFLQSGGAGADLSYGTPTGQASPLNTKMHLEYWPTNNGVMKAAGATVDGAFNGTNNIPAAGFTDAFYWQLVTSTTAGVAASGVGSTTNGGPINFLWDFDLSFIIRTDLTAVTGNRIWIGLCNGNPGNVDALTVNAIMFRYSTVAGDPGWVGVTYDGTQAVTGNVGNIAANTRYTLRIRKVSGTVFFSVNGAAEISTTTHVPTNDQARAPVLAVINTAGGAGSARSLYFSRLWADYAT